MNKNSQFVEIPSFFWPLKVFSATQEYSSHFHFQHATEILGIEKNSHHAIYFTKDLASNCSRSMAVLQSVSNLWLRPYGIHQVIHIDHFRSSVIFPLWLKHLKSYNNDAVIKQLVALHAIYPLPYLTQYGLLNAGIIPDLEPPSEMLSNINSLCHLYHQEFSIFLLNPQFSDIFHCTSDDYADAHANITHFLLLKLRSPSPEAHLLKAWAKSLINRNQSATPALLTAVEYVAQEFYDEDSLSKYLTHQVEEDLLGWLKKLPDPPNHIIKAWQKVFSKARNAARKYGPGYSNYFCDYVHLYPTKTCQVALGGQRDR
ncbi:hypothetical protein BDQ17DRAFT_1346138 [Cyathus striatus]|nr:hypothetical protein BDQ17DRAFT_1346138 [Cyathus striatus]